ncbi:caspase-6-like [Takifugu flavidus]|uniref:caspase-6-like n=1 Tax=Takifugu flavidus TaxID=433684 RepID=UPI002544AFCE|nr:caspase-6-like [Takifugu flavidus]
MSNKTEDIPAGSDAELGKTATDSSACTGDLSETDAISGSIGFLDPAEEYKMDNKRRGLALIFNQERFFWRLGLRERHGTNADSFNLQRRLKELNFEVKVFDNHKQAEVLEIITSAAKDDHSNVDCFLVVFLSHGENNHIYTYDDKINVQDIASLFKGDKCKSLVGKPKIFILQACRGDKHDEPATAAAFDDVDSELKKNEVEVDASAVYTLPAGADFIMCYSVAEGYYSHREIVNGSWYIQDLCELLRKYGDSLEFTELLTLVNRKVSMRSVGYCSDPNAIGKKQVPCFASMLTKKLYFRPKK